MAAEIMCLGRRVRSIVVRAAGAGFTLLLLVSPARAHLPRIPAGTVTEVLTPDVSQAFYAELRGAPDEYRFEVKDSLLLYVGLLVPTIPNVTRDYSADIMAVTDSGERPIGRLDGPASEWKDFWEPFAGDHYWQGPEARQKAGPGKYLVRVSSPDNLGKYVLAIGEREAFTPSEIARTTALLPTLKKGYLGKSAWTAFFNRSGLFLGGTLVLVAGVIVLVVVLVGRARAHS